jgi:T4 RnlA family RNA ligase
MALTINGDKQICNINKLYANATAEKVYRALDLKVGIEVGEFNRKDETVGEVFTINSIDKEVLATERPENSWMYNDVKDLDIVRVANKDDGSAIRFLILNGELVAKTKFSLESEQTEIAMTVVNADDNLKAFILKTLELGLAALFEIVSPHNKIVLSYNYTTLKLLQLRDEETGEYLDIYAHPLVEEYDVLTAIKEPLYTLDELLELKETVEEKEGWVITFANGKMAKVKTDWYMSLHSLMTDGLKEHKIIARIVDETIDDVIAQIPEENTEERAFVDDITLVITKHINHITSDAEKKFKAVWKGDKKEIAMAYKADKQAFPYIMNFAKGRSYEEVEAIVAERVQFECRRLEMAKKYLRGLGFTNELKLLEDDE